MRSDSQLVVKFLDTSIGDRFDVQRTFEYPAVNGFRGLRLTDGRFVPPRTSRCKKMY